jgi:hypothetical protein
MNRSKSRLGRLMAQGVIILALGVSADAANAAARDQLYTNSELDGHQLTTVALLPVVASADNPGAERLVETIWVDLYEVRTRWMPADAVRARLAQPSGERGDLAAEVAGQVWRRGEVDPELAVRLARLLGVDALLSVRIDRWEIADGGRAIVEMTAVLSGADGKRLWGISGLAGCGAPRNSGRQNFNSEMGRFWNPRLEPPDRSDEKLGGALYTLLARWEASLPAAPLYAREGTSTPVERNSTY